MKKMIIVLCLLSTVGSFFSCFSLKGKVCEFVTELEAQLFIDTVFKDEASFKSFRSFLLREFNFCINNSMVFSQIASRNSNFWWNNKTSLYQEIKNHKFHPYDPAIKKVYLHLHNQKVFDYLQEMLSSSVYIDDKAYCLKHLYSMSWGVCMLDLARKSGLILFIDIIQDLIAGKINTKKWKFFFTTYKKFLNMPLFPYLLIEGNRALGSYFNYIPLSQFAVINTPLIVAVKAKNELLTEWLIHNGAMPDKRNSEKKTALMVAASMNNYRFVRFLLECKADLSLSNYGRKAYDYATQDSVKNLLRVWEFMQQENVLQEQEDTPDGLSRCDVDDFIYGVLSVMANHPEGLRLRSMLTSSAYRCINRMQDLFEKIHNNNVLEYVCMRIKACITDLDMCNKLIDTLYWFEKNYVPENKNDDDFDLNNY